MSARIASELLADREKARLLRPRHPGLKLWPLLASFLTGALMPAAALKVIVLLVCIAVFSWLLIEATTIADQQKKQARTEGRQ